jgi:hypothetical protein
MLRSCQCPSIVNYTRYSVRPAIFVPPRWEGQKSIHHHTRSVNNIPVYFSIITLRGLTGIRTLTGECRSGSNSADRIAIETARRVVAGTAYRKSYAIAERCVRTSFAGHEKKNARITTLEYMDGLPDSRMTIPLDTDEQLFELLLEDLLNAL